MSKIKSAAGYFGSVKWGSISLIISFVRQLLLVPVFILGIGSKGYAFWLSMASIITIINSINTGHLHYTSNLLSLVYHKTGQIDEEIRQFHGANVLYLILQVSAGFIVLNPYILSGLTSFSHEYIIAGHLHLAFFIMLSGKMIYQYFSSFFLRLFEPLGNIQVTIKYRAIAEFAEFLAISLSIYLTKSILFTAMATFGVNILFTIFTVYFLKARAPFSVYIFQAFNLKEARKLLAASFVLNASFGVERIYEVGINLVVVRFFGASMLPVFTTSRIMTNIFYRVTNILILPVFPAIQKHFALSSLEYIYDKIKLFWNLSVPVIIVSVSIGLPLLPYIYSFWTKNELKYNHEVVSFLLIAISFQNFGTIINEFFKKTNFSLQLLTFNTIKLGVTVLMLLIFSIKGYKGGIGISFAAGEAISLIYLLFCFVAVFKVHASFTRIISHIMPTIMFSAAMVLFVVTNSYFSLIACNMVIVAVFFFNNKYLKSIKW